MKTMPPSLAIFAHNEESRILDCLKSLRAASSDADSLPVRVLINGSKDRTEAEQFAKWDGSIMEIKGKNGRAIEDYTKFQGQDEVVFDRNSKFRVTDVDKSSDQYKIFLEEL